MTTMAGPSRSNSRISRQLSAGAYTVEATTYSSGKTGSFTLTIQVTQSPTSDAPAPAGLVATAASATSIDLTWDAVTDAASYKLDHRIGAGGLWTASTSPIRVSSTGVASAKVGVPACGDTHYFRVSARGDGSPYSTSFGPWSVAVAAAVYCETSTTVGRIDDDGAWTGWSGEWLTGGRWLGPPGLASVPRNVSFDISFTDLEEDRAYLVRAEYETAGTTGLQPLVLNSVTAPSGYKELGDGRVVWVAGSSSTANVRFEASAPGTPTGYQLSVTKPNVVFAEKPTASLWSVSTNTGPVRLPLAVRNTSGVSQEVKIEVYCDVERGSSQTRTRFVSSRHYGSFTVPATGTGWSVIQVSSICQGVVLKSGDKLTFEAHLLYGSRWQDVSSNTVVWTHDVASTLFHHHSSNLMGGLQISAGGWCTSSFTLGLRHISSNAHHDAISTTDHCVENVNVDWYQGPNQGRSNLGRNAWPADMKVADTTTLAASTTCSMIDIQGIATSTTDCTIGDHAYGQIALHSSATSPKGYIFKPATKTSSFYAAKALPKLEYFAGDPSVDRFRIQSARPPVNGDLVNKVGRTTGWTHGVVNYELSEKDSTPTPDPTCAGGRQGILENKRGSESGYIQCKFYTTLSVAGGDSGAPVFVIPSPVADDVILVGVVFSQVNDRAVFIPIDRIYAESLSRGYDWEPAALRPVPAPLSIYEKIIARDPTIPPYIDTLTVKATFDKALLSPTLYYRADLLPAGTTTPQASCYITTSERSKLGYEGYQAKNTDEGYACDISEKTHSGADSDKDFTDVIVSFNVLSTSLTGTFEVKLKGCMEDSSGDDLCGGYGSDGSQTLTLAARSGNP